VSTAVTSVDGIWKLGGLARKPTSPDQKDLKYKLTNPLKKALPNGAVRNLIEVVRGTGLRLNLRPDAVRVVLHRSAWRLAPPIVQVNDAAEAALAGELEGNAEIPRQPGIAAADDDRVDERVKLVDEVRGYHRRREVWATDGEVAFARRLEPANLVGIEGAFDARASRTPSCPRPATSRRTRARARVGRA
jgi:hypothetical protein